MNNNDKNNNMDTSQNPSQNILDDPALTAYALGEFDVEDAPEELKRIEGVIASNEDARRFVEEVRATANLLADELKSESAPALSSEDENAIADRAVAESSRRQTAGEQSPYSFPLIHTRWFKLSAGLAAVAVIAVTASIVIQQNQVNERSRQLAVNDSTSTETAADELQKTVRKVVPPSTVNRISGGRADNSDRKKQTTTESRTSESTLAHGAPSTAGTKAERTEYGKTADRLTAIAGQKEINQPADELNSTNPSLGLASEGRRSTGKGAGGTYSVSPYSEAETRRDSSAILSEEKAAPVLSKTPAPARRGRSVGQPAASQDVRLRTETRDKLKSPPTSAAGEITGSLFGDSTEEGTPILGNIPVLGEAVRDSAGYDFAIPSDLFFAQGDQTKADDNDNVDRKYLSLFDLAEEETNEAGAADQQNQPTAEPQDSLDLDTEALELYKNAAEQTWGKDWSAVKISDSSAADRPITKAALLLRQARSAPPEQITPETIDAAITLGRTLYINPQTAVDAYLNAANQNLSENEIEVAQKYITEAQTLFEKTKNLTISTQGAETQPEAPQTQATDLAAITAAVETAQKNIEASDEVNKQLARAIRNLNERIELENEKLQQANRFLVEVRNLYENHSYRESLEKIHELRTIDPDDPAGIAVQKLIYRATPREIKQQIANEEYARLTDNPFHAVSDQPLSTFSVDVDTASYANVRRYINQMATIPPADAVRIEELINNFDYSYTAPPKDAEHPFAVHTEIAECPWNLKHRLAKIGLKGYEVLRDDRPATNLVFLIDSSGSMRPENKLPLIRKSLVEMINNLTVDDRIAIVTYAGSSRLVLDSTSVHDKQKIIDAINNLGAGGSTNGAGGITQAYKVATENFIKEGVNRVILCTDGDFNVGVSDHDGLMKLIEQKRKTGVFLSVLGFGMGNFKDNKLETLADKGNGNYAYIDNYDEARKVLVDRMAGTLVTIAKDVKLQLDFNPAAGASYRLIGYENRVMAARDFNDDTKDAGEIGAGHTVTALYEIITAGSELVPPSDVDDSVYVETKPTERARDSGELFTVRLRYKQGDADESTLWTIPVKDADESLAEASTDFRFAAAVAEFGMVLRQSPYRGNLSAEQLLDLAQGGISSVPDDDNSQSDRAEFVTLIKRTYELAPDLFKPFVPFTRAESEAQTPSKTD